MKGKDNDGDCTLPKVSAGIADERKQQAASLFDDQSTNGREFVDGSEQRTKVLRICIAVINDYEVPATYGAEDLYQNVMFRFWKYLPRYRGEASLSTIIRKVALNQLIDMRRKGWKNVPTSEARNHDGETQEEADFTANLKRGHRETTRNVVADQADRAILAKELTSRLSVSERSLCERLDIETPTEIAEQSGVSRQAISQRRDRIYDRMRMIVKEGDSRMETKEECRTLGSQQPADKALFRQRATA